MNSHNPPVRTLIDRGTNGPSRPTNRPRSSSSRCSETRVSDQLLLDDRLAPMTSELGFVQAPVDVVAEALMDWQQSVHGPYGARFTSRGVTGDLEQLLNTLLPLTTPGVRRFLLLPTAAPQWTAYFDNGAGGSSAFPHLVALARLAGLRGVRAVVVPDTASGRGSTPGGRYGATVFEVYGESKAHLEGIERSVELLDDGGKWRFSQDGPPLPFEDLDAYRARRVRDRFPRALLAKYLGELGLRPFEETFYAPAGSGVLIEKQGAAVDGSRSLTLAEARASY